MSMQFSNSASCGIEHKHQLCVDADVNIDNHNMLR